MHLIFAGFQQRGIECQRVFAPDALVGIVTKGIGGHGLDGADALAVDGNWRGRRDWPSAPASASRRVACPCSALSMLNLIVQVVAWPRPMVRHISCARCAGAFTQPKRWLAGSLASGFCHAVDSVRHLLEEPVLVVVALADGVGDVVGEQQRVAQPAIPRASSSRRLP